MLSSKKQKNDPLQRNNGLNRSIRTKNRKKRVHDQVHVGLQDRLEKEMKIRDGATRLISACTHETQLLEAAKTLHTSNARTTAYLAQLQKLKATEVIEAITDEPQNGVESKICKGRIAISDIRVPLVWKEAFSNTKSKDSNRLAVFCLVTVGSEVQDTELVCVERTDTDISFTDVVVFEKASYDFKLNLELFVCPMSNRSVSAPTPQKLFSRLKRSAAKNEGKRVKEQIKENSTNGNKNAAPYYEKIASTSLTLGDLSDAIKSHDLQCTNSKHRSLPLYESMTCRLVAQPQCVTDISVSGFLHVLEMVGAVPNWSYLWCEVKSGTMKGWKNPEDLKKKPHFEVDLLPKDVKINEIEKLRQKRAHSFQVRDLTDRHIFAARNNEDLITWIRGLRKHKSDHGAWGASCVSGPCDRIPMFIASPSPRKVPSDLMFDRSVFKTMIYDQLDSPLRALAEVNHSNNISNDDRVVAQSVLLENQTTAPWSGFFSGGGSKSAKVTRITDIQRLKSEEEVGRHSYNLRSSPIVAGKQTGSELSGSDDAFFSDSESQTFRLIKERTPISTLPPKENMKKKRRAPMSPWDKINGSPLGSPPPKPPLPDLSAKHNMKLGVKSSSVDHDVITTRSRDDQISLRSQRSSQSSGYKSEKESVALKPSERVWVNERNQVIPPLSGAKSRLNFERSKSLDADCSNDKNLPRVDFSSPDPRHCTNSIAERSSPYTSVRMDIDSPNRIPRRSYLNAVESTKTDPNSSHPSGHVLYRPLHYNSNAEVYCQSKPPPLPPKLKKVFKKASSFPVPKDKEPIYAEIDRSKLTSRKQT